MHSNILKAVLESGYVQTTPIQQLAIPDVIGGFDIHAAAPTGTGKTAAFILPALNRIVENPPLAGRGPRILILVPTRELAMQVASQAVKYSKYLTRVKTVCIYGGAPYPIQNRELSRPYEILVATPGRLIDHMEQNRIDFSRMEMFVLDEADRMLDMGFISAVEDISKAIPNKVQTLLFSATMKGNVLKLSKKLLNSPKEINLVAEENRHENIEQKLHCADNLQHKIDLLDHFLCDDQINQAIIFTSTKRYADQLVDELMEKGHSVAALHGDLNQRKRTATITRLRQGKIKVLVATDVAARGIDVRTITHVINFDLPRSIEDYVHRIGRTGRAEDKGIAISLVSAKDLSVVKEIEKFIGIKLDFFTVPGLEARLNPTMKVRPSAPPSRRRNFKGRSNAAPPRSSSQRGRFNQFGPKRSGPSGNQRNFSRPPRKKEFTENF